jgi:hypothetical protein
VAGILHVLGPETALFGSDRSRVEQAAFFVGKRPIPPEASHIAGANAPPVRVAQTNPVSGGSYVAESQPGLRSSGGSQRGQALTVLKPMIDCCVPRAF